MPKYKECGRYECKCPCVACEEDCYGCVAHECEEYAVDTDKLCERARAFCESGRTDHERVH